MPHTPSSAPAWPTASTAPQARRTLWPRRLGQKLYVRIWLAVVLGVALLMAAVALAWHASAAHQTSGPGLREWVVRDAQGRILATTRARPLMGQPLALDVPLPNGQHTQLQLELRMEPGQDAPPPQLLRRNERLRHMAPPQPWWARPPYGFIGLLALIGVGAALALYPVVRRLTRRLHDLQHGVQRWGEGDLSVRLPDTGDDEVADLSRRFNAAAQRIEQLMATQKSLLANASHELRSPLARTRMGLELLHPPDAPDATPVQARLRQEVLRNVAELDELVEEILLCSRLDATASDMGQIEVVDWLGLCAEECARVDAQLIVAEGLAPPQVQGVPRLLRRLLRNLLENATRHAHANDQPVRLHVDREAHSQALRVRVCDSGPGVPSAYRERIFEPFFRLPGASETQGGVGLGLALVRAIALRHGWRVSCQPSAQGGACFELRMT